MHESRWCLILLLTLAESLRKLGFATVRKYINLRLFIVTEIRSCRLEVAQISTIRHQLCLTSLIAIASRVHAAASHGSIALSLMLQIDIAWHLIRRLLASLWLVLFCFKVLDIGLRVAERIVAAHALKT